MGQVAWVNTRPMVCGTPYGMASRGQEEPDWLCLCDESSPHRRALHISVQILAGKFKMELLPTISLIKAFPVAQMLETILCKFGRICATGNAFVRLIVGRNSILNFPAKI